MSPQINKSRFPLIKSNHRFSDDLNSNRLEIKKIKEIVVESLPAHGTYGELLFDERWRKKREGILIRDNRKCIICKKSDELQVHHRQYHFIKAINKFCPPWEYDNSLLITLCKKCHQKGHYKYKVPTISI